MYTYRCSSRSDGSFVLHVQGLNVVFLYIFIGLWRHVKIQHCSLCVFVVRSIPAPYPNSTIMWRHSHAASQALVSRKSHLVNFVCGNLRSVCKTMVTCGQTLCKTHRATAFSGRTLGEGRGCQGGELASWWRWWREKWLCVLRDDDQSTSA